MEFDDEERQEEQNDDVEEQQQIDTPPQPQPPNSLSPAGGRKPVAAAAVRYKECQKNHAIRIGGHAIDGCGEFMATGPEGTLEALKCAACNCHRNFHRKETAGVLAMYPPAPPPVYLHQPHPHVAPHVQQPVPLAAARPSSSAEEPSSGGEGSGRGRKRFRTKFTAEQKEKMLAFAERAGWRIQKHDEAEVQRFCQEVKVNRQVLKVWMHNNKNNNSARNP